MKSQWDERYEKKEYYYGIEPNTFLAQHASLFPKGGRILCLAEGEGRNAVFLAKQGFEVTAIDSSRIGLEKLSALAQSSNVTVQTICQDLNDFVFEENRWDGIVSVWCHLPRQLRFKVHASIAKSLKPGGIFLLEAYTPEQLKFKTGGPSNPDLMPTLSSLEVELQKLKPLVKVEINRSISEGIGHQGMSAVVQYIGQKERA